jgi:hypothetical protein
LGSFFVFTIFSFFFLTFSTSQLVFILFSRLHFSLGCISRQPGLV